MSQRRIAAALCLLIRSGAALASQSDSIVLVPPFEVEAVEAGNLNSFRIGKLAAIDPDHPLRSQPDTQTLSLFGREDLIANIGDDYPATDCAPVSGTRDVVDEIAGRAAKTSVVIINESHERSEHRGFTASLLTRLRRQGYTALALEALAHPPDGTPTKYLPSVLRDAQLPYLEDDDGYYLGEAAFGRMGRTAKRLGYTLIPYEERPDGSGSSNLSQQEQIARREEAQASTLASWIKVHAGAKLIVHVGYHHATEVARADGSRWMATRLRAKTGIDPLTVSQTTCRGGGIARRLAVIPADELPGTFDLIVDHPTAQFVKGRPTWRIAAGDVPVDIPASLRPTKGWRIIEARLEGEPAAAVPMDRVAVRPNEDVALLLPPGHYTLRAIDPVRGANSSRP